MPTPSATQSGHSHTCAPYQLSVCVELPSFPSTSPVTATPTDIPVSSRRLVGIMERVQAGLLGQTASAFGITGLCAFNPLAFCHASSPFNLSPAISISPLVLSAAAFFTRQHAL